MKVTRGKENTLAMNKVKWETVEKNLTWIEILTAVSK